MFVRLIIEPTPLAFVHIYKSCLLWKGKLIRRENYTIIRNNIFLCSSVLRPWHQWAITLFLTNIIFNFLKVPLHFFVYHSNRAFFWSIFLSGTVTFTVPFKLANIGCTGTFEDTNSFLQGRTFRKILDRLVRHPLTVSWGDTVSLFVKGCWFLRFFTKLHLMKRMRKTDLIEGVWAIKFVL